CWPTRHSAGGWPRWARGSGPGTASPAGRTSSSASGASTQAAPRRASSNTVQLASEDVVGRRVPGLGPLGVVGAFDVPLDVLAFDDPGVGSRPAGRVEATEEPA
ncbi:MAG TPA: hypothetical protein VFT53_03865, partial [Candidatus Saccharimonadales bacterium]|nr:hypothetical protein [Candidatus Saccharimonadales bacterium]